MPAKPDYAALRIEGKSIKDRLTADTARLKEIEAVLVAGGAGKFGECTVVDPSVSYVFPSGAGEEAKLRELAGDDFPKIFETVKTLKPVKSFADAAAAVFKGRASKLKAILSRCEKVKVGFVKWNT